MNSLARGQVITPAAPALMFISQNQGQIVPANTLSWRILRAITPAEQADPAVVTTGTVDLVNDIVPIDPQNTTAGVYVPRWTVPSDAPVGRYFIEWTYALTNPSSSILTTVTTENPPAGVTRKVFEVVAAPSLAVSQPLYSLVCDARDNIKGCGEDVSDVALQKLLVRASRAIERVTGRYFGPRYSNLRLGGNSARILQTGEAIVGVSSIGIDTQPTQTGDLVVELDLVRIFNRHLSQGITNPDDRENPKIEFVHSDDLYGIRFVPFRGISLRSLAWPIGVQNIHVRGFWGFVDPDDSPWGEVPEQIQHVTRLIAAREISKIGSDAREDAQWRWRVTSQKSRDVTIEMDSSRKWGEWYGDPEIDSILASYVRPPMLGDA